jgi:hypothetical protein
MTPAPGLPVRHPRGSEPAGATWQSTTGQGPAPQRARGCARVPPGRATWRATVGHRTPHAGAQACAGADHACHAAQPGCQPSRRWARVGVRCSRPAQDTWRTAVGRRDVGCSGRSVFLLCARFSAQIARFFKCFERFSTCSLAEDLVLCRVSLPPPLGLRSLQAGGANHPWEGWLFLRKRGRSSALPSFLSYK